MPTDKSHERTENLLTTLLFGLSAYWGVQKILRDRHRRAISGKAFPSTYSGTGNNGDLDNALIVSPRCRNAMSPSTPYLMSFLRGLEYVCTPASPDGYVLLCVAENKLAIDLLSKRLQNSSTTMAAFSDPVVYCYNSFLGLPVARQAVSYFLARHFLHPQSTTANPDQPQSGGTRISLESALQSINPAHIGIGSGAAGILNGKIVMIGVFQPERKIDRNHCYPYCLTGYFRFV